MAKNFDQNRSIDPIDKRIMAELARDGRLSIAKLSERVGLSKSPCQTRVKRLVDDGLILGFRAVLNPKLLGLEHVAFVEIRLSDTREPALVAFNTAIRSVREVEECHMIAGAFDYLLKVRTRDIVSYRRVLGEVISTLPNVAATSTHVVMESVKQIQD